MSLPLQMHSSQRPLRRTQDSLNQSVKNLQPSTPKYSEAKKSFSSFIDATIPPNAPPIPTEVHLFSKWMLDENSPWSILRQVSNASLK